MQRRRTVNDYNILKLRLSEQMSRLEEQCSDHEKQFRAIYKDLHLLTNLMTKAADYFGAKVDNLGALSRENATSKVTPLFLSMNEPSERQVGHLIDLKCGHTQRPTDLEAVMFTVHLQAAGFMSGTGSVGSPQRCVAVSGASSQNHEMSPDRKSTLH